MAEFAAIPFFTDAWIADTAHLTRLERGIYMDLLILIWRSPECRVPNDMAWIARRLRADADEVETLHAIIAEFCKSDGNWITQKRLRREWDYTQEKRRKNIEAANARWQKGKGACERNAGNAGGASAGAETADASAGAKNSAPRKQRKRRDKSSCERNAPSPSPSPSPSEEEEEPKGSLSSGDDDEAPAPKPLCEIAEAVAAYNRAAEAAGWPQVRVLSKARRAALGARLRECGGLNGWAIALAKARDSPHCCGQNDRGWTANFDFLTRQSSFAKLMEGNYDQRAAPQAARAGQRPAHADAALSNIARLAGLGGTSGHGGA